MKQKFILFGMSLTILLACFSGAEAKQSTWSDQELLDITRVMEQSDITIEGWSFYGKNNFGFVSDFTGYVSLVESLQAKSPNFRWGKIVETKEHWNVTGHYKNPYGIEEKVSVFAYPHKNQYMAYIIYYVQGKSWDPESWKAFKPEYRHKVQLFLGENAKIYTCVEGIKSDKMGIVLQKLAKQLVQSFDASIIETLNEETFLSLSAYTDEWKPSIQSDRKRMNLQIGLRNSGIGGKTTITIGTPIITTEY
ncbi:YwmB family TATA-box binding protein [Alkalihalobacillus sp. TS-13]|uniref:YwmB family TATA-box binding protein n=1 Tax=Alkalihalobacillus sp. TS-13 TaxID=2842455 RepID=UPI001C87AAA5|nr:YwmB family TATA-box binding protein [Alkalihalobacillus sp. TS-13]